MSRSDPLDRAFRILDIVVCAGREMPLVDIVAACRLPQSTVFRLAAHLVDSGMLAFDETRKVYGPGPRCRRLGLFLRGRGTLRDIVDPVLADVARRFAETAFCVTGAGDGNRLLHHSVPEVGGRAFVHPGFEFPAHATAAGKVIRAFSGAPEPPGEDLPKKFQPATVTDQDALERVYGEIRKAGYALNDSEYDPGVFSMAAPVRVGPETVAALGIVGPRDRMFSAGDPHERARMLVAAADELAALLCL
ncbi:MAG: IclR family transcriptional regulator [Pseudomonadota bacterium]